MSAPPTIDGDALRAELSRVRTQAAAYRIRARIATSRTPDSLQGTVHTAAHRLTQTTSQADAEHIARSIVETFQDSPPAIRLLGAAVAGAYTREVCEQRRGARLRDALARLAAFAAVIDTASAPANGDQ